MKDKQAKRLTMSDLHNEYQENDIIEKQITREIDSIKEEKYSKELNDDIKLYNQNIKELDPLYSNLMPITDIIVRVFLIEPQVTESGLIIPHKVIMPIPTNAGVGNWAEAESPYPYSKKAIIVATPKDHPFLKQGDIVQLSNNPVTASVVGSGSNAVFAIKQEFVHADSNLQLTPQDVKSRHYGYLLVSPYDIKVKLA